MTGNVIQGLVELFLYWTLLYVLMGSKVLDLSWNVLEWAQRHGI